jgi:hypothetical protein
VKPIKEAFDHETCAECGGRCCLNASCIAHPSDFGDSKESIREALLLAMQSGMWVIDYWEGNCPGLPKGATGYFVRPRMGNNAFGDLVGVMNLLLDKKESGWLVPCWGGTCLFLEEGGCCLPDDARPMGARTLEPRKSGSCIQHSLHQKSKNEKPTFALAWREYEDVIDWVLEQEPEGKP